MKEIERKIYEQNTTSMPFTSNILKTSNYRSRASTLTSTWQPTTSLTSFIQHLSQPTTKWDVWQQRKAVSPERFIYHNISSISDQFNKNPGDITGIVDTAMRTTLKRQPQVRQHGVNVDLVDFIEVIEMFPYVHPTLKVVWNVYLQLATLDL